jgi:ATP-dependent Clp protease protease subunit
MKKFRMMGVIVDDAAMRWSDDDVTPAQVEAFLRAAGPDEDIELEINSPGGSVTAGIAIANLISAAGNNVTAAIYGMAASMASVIACACDSIRAFPSSYMMVHNPWTIAAGEAKDFRKAADTLDAFRATLIGFYTRKIGKSAEEIAGLMDAETWIAGKDFAAIPIQATVEDPSEQLDIAACVGPAAFAKMPEDAKRFYNRVENKPRLPASGGSVPTPTPEPETEPKTEIDSDSDSDPDPETKTETEIDSETEPETKTEPEIDPDSDSEPDPERKTAPHAPSAEFRALLDRCEAVEAQRRDIQSRADRLANELAAERTAHAATRTGLQARVDSLDAANKDFQARLSRMALNALSAPTGGCAQSWAEALKECGGYDEAARKYPHLAEAYRKERQGR